MKNDIDEIMSLISWEREETDQKRGICQANEIECINAFLQPRSERFNKNVWGNCAIILSNRTDNELSPYLIELLSWLQDMNWPGAFCILNRLNRFSDKRELKHAYDIVKTIAKAINDDTWYDNLHLIHM